MQFTPKKSVKKFQQGGQVAPEAPMPEKEMPAEGAPQEAPQDNPLMALVEAAMQGLQTQDCQIMAQVCQGLVELAQQMQEPAPQEATGEPVFKKGGVLLRRVKK